MRQAVIGLGFGDEGKGCTTSWLSSQSPDSTVVRYSGGPQAGHHVIYGAEQHIFSTFGSGSLNGTPTFISGECVVDPMALLREYEILKDKCTPELHLSFHCPLITPLDIMFNHSDESNLRHGSCGCGINAMLRRQDDLYSIVARDMLYPEILKAKVESLMEHYYETEEVWDPTEFYAACKKVAELFNIADAYIGGDLIYEGSQGLLLDKDIGIFPHVTPYNVGMRGIGTDVEEAYFVTRAYSTRHGAGPLLGVDPEILLNDNPLEINVFNEYQGEFQKGMLNADVLSYALDCDDGELADEHILVITCLEHMVEWKYWFEGDVKTFYTKEAFCRQLALDLNMDKYVMCQNHQFSNTVEVRYNEDGK